MIETTINMRDTVLFAVDNAARASGKTRSGVLVILLRKVLKDHGFMTRFDKRVQYQEKDETAVWEKAHVYLTERDYELFLDGRRFFKRSVSLLIALAVERYLDKLVELLLSESYDEEADNYPLPNYIIAKKMSGSVVGWHIFWGFPPWEDLKNII